MLNSVLNEHYKTILQSNMEPWVYWIKAPSPVNQRVIIGWIACEMGLLFSREWVNIMWFVSDFWCYSVGVWLLGEYHVICGCYSAGSGKKCVIIKWFGLWIIHESFTKSYVIQCCNKLKSQGNHMWITCDFWRNQCVIHMWLRIFFLLGN